MIAPSSVGEKDVPSSSREFLLDSEAFCLFNLGKLNEGIAHYDDRISNAKTYEHKLVLVGGKAQMLRGKELLSQSIAAWQNYFELSKRGTDNWNTAASSLAWELQRANEHDKAMEVLLELIQTDDEPFHLLSIAESHIAIGELRHAREYISKCEARLLNLTSEQKSRGVYKSVAERAKRLRLRINEITENSPAR